MLYIRDLRVYIDSVIISYQSGNEHLLLPFPPTKVGHQRNIRGTDVFINPQSS